MLGNFTQFATEPWIPSDNLLYLLLVVGALLTAGVVVMVFSLYVDEYWKDEEFRLDLRFGSKRNGNPGKATKV